MKSIAVDLEDLKFQKCRCCTKMFCNLSIVAVPTEKGTRFKILEDDMQRPCPDCQKELEKQIFKSSEN